MAIEAEPFVQLSTVSGEPVILEPSVRPEDEVIEIRRRVGSALGVHQKQVILLHGVCELADGDTMGKALGESCGPYTVSVIHQVCQIRASDYESHIDRDAVGVLEVEKIRYNFGYPATEKPDDGGAVPSTDPERIKQYESRSQSFRQRPVAYGGTFPAPQDININMMPFIIGKKDSVPEAYQQYWPLIQSCLETLDRAEFGKVGYLTIHESLVKKGDSQRRGGLHIESPGRLREGGSFNEDRYYWGCSHGIIHRDQSSVDGGIYMASSVANSCRVWDVQVRNPASVVGKLGDLEHVREVLGEGSNMEAGKIYWMTDVTPHESLPLEEETFRQFFRFVTSSLSAWYPENATPNPLGIEPDPKTTKIVAGNKFSSEPSA